MAVPISAGAAPFGVPTTLFQTEGHRFEEMSSFSELMARPTHPAILAQTAKCISDKEFLD